jgi:hypothetical protein
MGVHPVPYPWRLSLSAARTSQQDCFVGARAPGTASFRKANTREFERRQQ